jgi:hypothetical protein
LDEPEAEPPDQETLVGLTRPPVAFHLMAPVPDPSALLWQLAMKRELRALSVPDVTVTVGFPVVPVEQLSLALIDMTVETGTALRSGGLNLTRPCAWHCTVPVAAKGDAAAESEPIHVKPPRVSARIVGTIAMTTLWRTMPPSEAWGFHWGGALSFPCCQPSAHSSEPRGARWPP